MKSKLRNIARVDIGDVPVAGCQRHLKLPVKLLLRENGIHFKVQ